MRGNANPERSKRGGAAVKSLFGNLPPFAVVSEALKSSFEQSVNFEANPPDSRGSDV
jgi:hypothetical protein